MSTFSPHSMSNFSTDGPNYEAVFRKMNVLHGGNPEDVKTIVRFLRFFQGTEEYEVYAKHYLPMLSPEVAAEFQPKEEPVVTETTVTEIEAQPSQPVTETVSISAPKKKGRSSK